MKRRILNESKANGPEPITTATSSWKVLLTLSACVFVCGAMSVFGVRAYTSKGSGPDTSPAHNSTTRAPNTASNILAGNSAESAVSDPLSGPAASENTYSASSHAAQQAPPKAKLTDSALITITPGGFDVAQITSPAVPFFLLVENRSGLEEVSLRLDRVAGTRLSQVTVTQEHLDWSDLLDLSPGEYVLSEASHQSWFCHITITSK